MRSPKRARTGAPNQRNATGRIIVIAVIAVVIVGSVAGIAVYRDRVMPFRTIVLEVDGTAIRMRYFLKRAAMSRASTVTVLQTLAQEQTIKEEAARPPYQLAVTPQEVDRFARVLAQGDAETIGESEFKEWYRQQLNENRLTDGEYREFLGTQLLIRRMSDWLGERVPTVAEQVFVNLIAVKDLAAAAEVKEKYDAGQDFAVLAREYSVDPASREQGGRIGWFPRGVLDHGLDDAAFGLEIGEASDPLSIGEQMVVVIMVSERFAAREIDEQSRAVLKSKALADWYQGEIPNHTVRFHGFHDGYDSETDAWVQRQLTSMRRQK
jgi:hypothetical protein